jgi:hypothetical protein
MLLRATLIAAPAALLALPVNATLIAEGRAYADTQDDQDLAVLSAQGIPGALDQTIATGHASCANYGSPALVKQMAGLMAQGLSNGQAQDVILDGLKAYCPEKAGGVPLP